MTSQDFVVRLAEERDREAVLATLADAYGRSFTSEWFRWKHLQSPWGVSRCWLAEDEGGTLGVVFGMPWPLRRDDATLLVSRLVDGATTVRSQRRGVFRALVQQELAAAGVGHGPAVVLATATPEARAAHIKNGAHALDPIRFSYQPVRWTTARLRSSADLLEERPTRNSDVTTGWDGPSLHWRVDPHCGHSYTISSLTSADRPHGVVYRATGHVVRTLVVVDSWGDRKDIVRTIRAAARETRSTVVLLPTGPGTQFGHRRVGLDRGRSLLCVWDDGASPVGDCRSVASWSLSGLDLEGVM